MGKECNKYVAENFPDNEEVKITALLLKLIGIAQGNRFDSHQSRAETEPKTPWTGHHPGQVLSRTRSSKWASHTGQGQGIGEDKVAK